MIDTQQLAELIRHSDSIHPDDLTDEILAFLTETLARYTRKHLPEGFVVRLDCSAYAHGVTLLQVTDEEDDAILEMLSKVEGAPDHWGRACDHAIRKGQQ